MPDKDLRKQALRGGKTTSKKAERQSKESTPASSRPSSTRASRAASRIASRDVSDDDDAYSSLSDETNQSINSVDAFLENDEFRETDHEALKARLRERIEQILERKGSSAESREIALQHYNRMLTSHHCGDVLYGRVEEILAALGRSIKGEASSTETVLALKAVALTAISYHYDALYETTSSLLKRIISDAHDNPSKAAAMHCLGICASFGGASETEIAEICTFLLEIVQSDGEFIGADDNAEVVTAALQTYSYLLTEVQDIESESEDAVEAFIEQLDSNDVNVQIAAGEAIALLFEKSYTTREDDDSDDGEDDDSDDPAPDSRIRIDTSLVKRYNAYHNPSDVVDKVNHLANLSSKGLSKHDRRRLHRAFASILITVEDPRAGLQTNNSAKGLLEFKEKARSR